MLHQKACKNLGSQKSNMPVLTRLGVGVDEIANTLGTKLSTRTKASLGQSIELDTDIMLPLVRRSDWWFAVPGFGLFLGVA